MKAAIEVNLDDLAEDVRSRVASAILAEMDEGHRDKLIEAALTYLLTPRSSIYGSDKSPIEQAFLRGVSDVAEKIAQEAVEENRAKIEGIARNAVSQALDSEDVTKRVAKSLMNAWGYDY